MGSQGEKVGGEKQGPGSRHSTPSKENLLKEAEKEWTETGEGGDMATDAGTGV